MITKRPNRLQGLHNFLNSFKNFFEYFDGRSTKKRGCFYVRLALYAEVEY
mgnify:CR=1 FL=1